MRANRAYVKRACEGVELRSSMSTGGAPESEASSCDAAVANLAGAMRPPTSPAMPAPSTMSGNGAPSAKIARKTAPAMVHSHAFF